MDKEILRELRQYFESAHLDAREVFHRAARIDLHPDADASGGHAQYPNCLPNKTKKGLFGEVMAGLLTEAYQFVGSHKWTIPVFLFRYHAAVEAYLFDLARDKTRVREVAGRQGNDFIALGIDPASGEVVRFIAGEAKWRTDLKPSTMDTLMLGNWTGSQEPRVRANDGVWHEMNVGLPVPQGLEQLSRIIQEIAPEQYAAAIVSVDRMLLLDTNPPGVDPIQYTGSTSSITVTCAPPPLGRISSSPWLHRHAVSGGCGRSLSGRRVGL